MSTDYLYLVSNGSAEIYSNSLTNFKNDVNFGNKRIEEIALSEIWVEDIFTSDYLPKLETLPAIIHSKIKPEKMTNLMIKKVTPTEKYFLPYSNFKYNEIFESITKCAGFRLNSRGRRNEAKISLWYQSISDQTTFFGPYTSSKTGTLVANAKRYYCYIYKPLSEALRDAKGGEDTNPVKTISLFDHDFDVYKINDRGFYFQCKQDYSDDKERQFKDLATNFSPFLFVETSCIENQYFNSTLKRILSSVTLEKDRTQIVGSQEIDTEKYTCFHKEFLHPCFFKVATQNLSTIQIRLLDINLKQASLQAGRTTIVKLIIREKGNQLTSPMNDINITVTSQLQDLYENNTSAKFSTKLTEPVSLFGSKWYCALISCSVPTRFKLPFDESTRSITFRISGADGTVRIRNIIIPDDVQSAGEIIEALEQVILPSEAVFSIDEHTTGIKIKAKRPLQLFMRGRLIYFLGSADHYKDVNVARMNLAIEEELIMPFVPRFLQYYPNSLFLYCDFIEHTMVSGRNLRLLKILPAYYSNLNHGKTSSNIRNMEFKTLEFHSVNSKFLSTLNFEIRTQTGEIVPFSGSKPTLLQMIFTQKPDNK